MYSSMVFLTGSDHRERRQAAAWPFGPRQLAAYRSELGEIAEQLVDRLAAPGPRPVDLMEQLALPFASLSLGQLSPYQTTRRSGSGGPSPPPRR